MQCRPAAACKGLHDALAVLSEHTACPCCSCGRKLWGSVQPWVGCTLDWLQHERACMMLRASCSQAVCPKLTRCPKLTVPVAACGRKLEFMRRNEQQWVQQCRELLLRNRERRVQAGEAHGHCGTCDRLCGCFPLRSSCPIASLLASFAKLSGAKSVCHVVTHIVHLEAPLCLCKQLVPSGQVS